MRAADARTLRGIMKSIRAVATRISSSLGRHRRLILAKLGVGSRPRGGHSSRAQVYAGVASIPSREAGLEQAVRSIYSQVDRIYVYLNDYPAVPAFLQDDKIEVFRSHEHGDRGPAGKFFGLTRAKRGIYVSFDDDIIYPPDYVDTLVKAVRACEYKAVVGVHASYYPTRPSSFLDRVVYHYRKPNGLTVPVSVLGTGTVAFPIELVKLDLEAFRSRDRADLWFAAFLKEAGIPAVVIRHPAEWLADVQHTTESLFQRAYADPREHSAVIRKAQPWGPEDLVARSEGVTRGLAPVWYDFARFYNSLRENGPQAAAAHLLEASAGRGKAAGKRLKELLDMVELYCDLVERFSVCAALAHAGEEGAAAFAALLPNCARVDPSAAAEMARRAYESSPASRAGLAAVALRQYRAAGQIDEAKSFLGSLSSRGSRNRALARETIELLLASGDFQGVLRQRAEYEKLYGISASADLMWAAAMLHAGDADAAIGEYVERNGLTGKTAAALASHCQEGAGGPRPGFPGERLQRFETRLLQKARDCAPLIRLYAALGEREAAASLFRRAEAALRGQHAEHEVELLNVASQPDATGTLAAINRVLASDGLEPLRSIRIERGCTFQFAKVEAAAAQRRTPLVSIVFVAMGGAGSVAASLGSVLAQSHGALEIIVVDRGGPAQGMLQDLAREDARIVLLRATDEPIFASRNRGVSIASGEFVAFQAAGAVAHPRKIEVQLDAVSDPDVTAACAQSMRLTAAGLVQLERNGRIVSDDWINAIVRAQAFKELGGFQLDAGADIEFRDRLVAYGGAHATVQLQKVLSFVVPSDGTADGGVGASSADMARIRSSYMRSHLLARGRREGLFVPIEPPRSPLGETFVDPVPVMPVVDRAQTLEEARDSAP